MRKIETMTHAFVYMQASNKDLMEQVFEDDAKAIKGFELKLKRHLSIEVVRRVVQINDLLEVARRELQESAKQKFFEWSEHKVSQEQRQAQQQKALQDIDQRYESYQK